MQAATASGSGCLETAGSGLMEAQALSGTGLEMLLIMLAAISTVLHLQISTRCSAMIILVIRYVILPATPVSNYSQSDTHVLLFCA